MTIGSRIKKRRLELELTQEQLARSLGLTAQHISALEQDKRTPSLSSLARLSEELGVTVDYLVTGREVSIIAAIPAIKADKGLSLRTKKALINLVEELYDKETRG